MPRYGGDHQVNETNILKTIKKYGKFGPENPPTRQILSDFLNKYYDLSPTSGVLTEAIFNCRGIALDNSDPLEYEHKKLVSWLLNNIPALVNMKKIQKYKREKEVSSA